MSYLQINSNKAHSRVFFNKAFLIVLFGIVFFADLVCSASLKEDQSSSTSNDIFLSDSFDNNTISGFDYFTYFDDCMEVQENHLVLASNKNKRCIINIQSIVGDQAVFQFSLNWPKKTSSRFHIYYDYRYNLHDEYGLIVFSSQKGKIYYRDSNRKWRSKRFPFKRNKWINFTLRREQSKITLYENGKELLSTTIRDKRGAKNVEEHGKYGGFAFGLDKRNFSQRIHIDNISVTGSQAPVQFDIIQQEFHVLEMPYTFSVIYEKGYEDWAHKQLEVSIPYISRLADLYGVPPVQKYMGIVQARGKYYFSGHGTNAKSGIVSRWPKENKYDRVDTHELAHNWGYLYHKEWLEEGAANLPRVLFGEKDSKDLMRINFRLKKEARKDFDNWIKDIFIDDNTFGWEGDMPTDKTDKFYWKASVLHRILYRFLGEEKYRELHNKIYEMGGNIDTEDFIKIFKEITGKSADPLLAGWVYPGKGKFRPEGAVKDDDNDGLNNLEEAVYGTDSQDNDSDNDWFSDFEEMRAGFNPLDPNEPGSQFIITDGITQDWEKVLFSFSDAKGDTRNVSGSPADFKSIKVYGDKLNNKVHLLITFHNQITFTKDSPYWLQVQLDLDGDGKLDNRVVFWLPSKKIRIISKYGMTGTRKETGVENRYLSSEGASVYYGNIQNHGFIEATFPLDHFSTKTGDSLTMKVKGGHDKAVDSFDQGPLPIDMQKIYNQAIPSQVFIPEVTL